MAVTININGLSLCHKASGGMSMATTPDVCKTPSPGGPVPVPYPNVATEQDLAKGTVTITADGGNMCANYGSEFSRSTGDEPGTLGGVKSGVFMREATWMTYSFDVKLEGKGACRLTDKMFHNHGNTVNMGGKLHPDLSTFVSDKMMNVLCNIFCEVLDEAKKSKKKPFPYSSRAKALGQGKYAQHLSTLGMKAEARTIVRLLRSQATRVQQFGRELLTRKEVVSRVSRQLAKIGAKTGAKVGAKAGVGAAAGSVVPGLGTAAGGVVMGAIGLATSAMDAYELAKAAGPLAEQMANAWAASNNVQIIPDIAVMGPDGSVKDMFDYKFDYKGGGVDRYHRGQDQVMQYGTKKVPKTVNKESCNDCQPRK